MDYYKNSFPANEVFRLATVNSESRPENVEIVSVTADGIWKRYNSIRDPAELRKLATQTAGGTIHLGPKYTEAAFRARGKGTIEGKTLAFDLDLQDIAFLRVLKNDQESNDRFTRLVFGHAHVLREIMFEVFGFEHFLPVFSGGRGVHLWVLDNRASNLTAEARKAIVAMIQPAKSKNDTRLFDARSIRSHPSFTANQVSDAMEEVFRKILIAPFSEGGVGLLDSRMDVENFLDSFFEEKAVDDGAESSKYYEVSRDCELLMRRELKAQKVVGPQAFFALRTVIETNSTASSGSKATPMQVEFQKLLHRLDDVVFTLCWPILDTGPTASMQHPIKLPFSLHKSGRISIPVAHLLPNSSRLQALPPIVYANRLDDDPDNRIIFKTAIETIRAAVNRIYHFETTDLEDLVSPISKVPRFL